MGAGDPVFCLPDAAGIRIFFKSRVFHQYHLARVTGM